MKPFRKEKQKMERDLKRSGTFARAPSYEQALMKIIECGSVYSFQKKFKDEVHLYGNALLTGVIEQLSKTPAKNDKILDLLNTSRFVRFLGSGGFGVTSLIESNVLGKSFRFVFKHILPVSGMSLATDKEKESWGDRFQMFWRKSSGNTKKSKILASHRLNRIRRSLMIQESLRKNLEEKGNRNIIIPEIYSIVEAPRATIVQEYCPGASVFEHCQKINSMAHRIEIIYKVAQGIEECLHNFKVIHCDLKPDNILISGDGTPIIIDFDLVKHLDAQEDITIVGEGLGSIRFSHPKQLTSAISRDIFSDIYTLGRVMWSCVLQRYPMRLEDFEEYELPEGIHRIFENTELSNYSSLEEFRKDLLEFLPKKMKKLEKPLLKNINWGETISVKVPQRYSNQIILSINVIKEIEKCIKI